MDGAKLSPMSYITLGLVELRGPSTPYELKAAINESIGYFWTFSHAQFYNEPPRLVSLGLMHEERERDGRRRRTFSITDAGREALQRWLAEPIAQRREMRDEGMLKLFFAELTGVEEIEELRRDQELRHRAMIAELEGLHERFGARDDLGYRTDTIRWGLAGERALAEFWAKLKVSPAKSRRLRPTRRRSGTG